MLAAQDEAGMRMTTTLTVTALAAEVAVDRTRKTGNGSKAEALPDIARKVGVYLRVLKKRRQ